MEDGFHFTVSGANNFTVNAVNDFTFCREAKYFTYLSPNRGILFFSTESYIIEAIRFGAEGLIMDKVHFTIHRKLKVSCAVLSENIYINGIKAGKLKNQIYSGKPIRLKEEDLKGVLNLNKALVPDEDFEVVTYNKNVKPGTAKVTLRGIGAFGGVRVLPFKIAPKQGDYRGAYIDGEWKTGS